MKKENLEHPESSVVGNSNFVHPLPEGELCVSPAIDVLDYCRVEPVSDGSYYIRNDASLLFHLRDVEKKYGATVANSLASRPSLASSVQSDMDKLSDEDLFKTIVPKYVQSPSEVKMFTEELGEMAASELSRLDSLLQSEASSGESDSSSSSVNGDNAS